MHRRAFVLVPLADIASADLLVPGHGVLGELLGSVDLAGIEPLPPAAAGEAGRTALC
jgi:2-amino-4-hydroxy-6-hydroxymethyldihydropteridine diphosphokinase